MRTPRSAGNGRSRVLTEVPRPYPRRAASIHRVDDVVRPSHRSTPEKADRRRASDRFRGASGLPIPDGRRIQRPDRVPYADYGTFAVPEGLTDEHAQVASDMAEHRGLRWRARRTAPRDGRETIGFVFSSSRCSRPDRRGRISAYCYACAAPWRTVRRPATARRHRALAGTPRERAEVSTGILPVSWPCRDCGLCGWTGVTRRFGLRQGAPGRRRR
jgi:hypothetical protein